jgi:3-phosphoshikimate 1-carboxyvinyltransferase
MGADIRVHDQREAGGEPVADLQARYASLKGVEIPESLVLRALDELPALFIAAACAEGQTIVHGAQTLRTKELDRISAMTDALRILGITVEQAQDRFIIEGGNMGGGEVDARGDHRIAMALGVASLRAGAPIHIHDCANVATSFPNFLTLCAQVGMRIAQEAQK